VTGGVDRRTVHAAGNPNVEALVYISAFIPDVGETVFQLGGPALSSFDFKKSPPFGENDVDVYMKADRFRAGVVTVEIDSSHVAMISHPGAVTDLIETAARDSS
jgi:hypothetical protein